MDQKSLKDNAQKEMDLIEEYEETQSECTETNEEQETEVTCSCSTSITTIIRSLINMCRCKASLSDSEKTNDSINLKYVNRKHTSFRKYRKKISRNSINNE